MSAVPNISILVALEIAIVFAGAGLFAACAISYLRVVNALSLGLLRFAKQNRQAQPRFVKWQSG